MLRFTLGMVRKLPRLLIGAALVGVGSLASDAHGQTFSPLPSLAGSPPSLTLPTVPAIPIPSTLKPFPAPLPIARFEDDKKPEKPGNDEDNPPKNEKPEKNGKKGKGDGDEEPKKENGEDEEKDKDKNADAPPMSDGLEAFRAVPTGTPLSLGECLAIAMQRQPALQAAEHSLRATELGLQALNNVSNLTTRLSPDIPIRRQQASRGISVATAEVQKVRNEIVYDVSRLYWTYVYARQQESTASDVIEQMEVFYNVVEEIVKAGIPDPKRRITQFTLYGLQEIIGEVKKLRVTAIAGRNASLAALHEAMGIGPDNPIVPRDTELPVMGGVITKEQVVEFALARRPELVQAASGVDAFRLEVCAQAQIRFRQSVPTHAAGSDLHSRPVPMPARNGEYKPGAVPPEMPPNLVGKTADRVARATEYSLRAEAVYEKTRNLIQLEAQNAYLNYASALSRMREAKKKLDNSRKMVEESRSAAAAKQDPEMLVRNEALAGKAQAEYLDAVFEHIKTLCTLERVTAGAVRPGFPGR